MLGWLTLGYILIWALGLNSIIFLVRKYQPVIRVGAWIAAWGLLLGLGAWFDYMTYLKPHLAYISWEFYMTHLIMSLLLSCPAYLWNRKAMS